MNNVEQELLNRIVYIGNEIPKSLTADDRPKFVVLGTPQEFIDSIQEKSWRQGYKLANKLNQK